MRLLVGSLVDADRGAGDLLLDEGERVLDGDLRGSLVDLEAELALAVDAVLVLLSQRLVILVLNELHAGSRLVTLELALVVVVIVVIVEVHVLLGSHVCELTLEVLELGVHLGDLGSLVAADEGRGGDDAGSAVGFGGTVLSTLHSFRRLNEYLWRFGYPVGRRLHLLLLGGRVEDFGHELISKLLVIQLRHVVHLVLVLDGGHGQRSGLGVVDGSPHGLLHRSGSLCLGGALRAGGKGEFADATDSWRTGLLRLEHDGATLGGSTDECRDLSAASQQHLLRESRLHVTGPGKILPRGSRSLFANAERNVSVDLRRSEDSTADAVTVLLVERHVGLLDRRLGSLSLHDS